MAGAMAGSVQPTIAMGAAATARPTPFRGGTVTRRDPSRPTVGGAARR